jgi:hypothetical protein
MYLGFEELPKVFGVKLRCTDDLERQRGSSALGDLRRAAVPAAASGKQ